MYNSKLATTEELLLELFSEEIPASMQKPATDALCTSIANLLSENGIGYKAIEGNYSPRRICIVASEVQTETQDQMEEKRGPRTDAPEAAISGFLKSSGLSLEQLEKRATDKGEFYFAVTTKKGGKVKDLLPKIIQTALENFSWPKSMRWNNYDIRWVRPLHNILCIFCKDVIPVKFSHLTANNHTKGHRFLSKGDITVKNFADYKQKLRENFVILDANERKEIILNSARKKAEELGLILKEDEALLKEVTGLVEFPHILLGRIEERFMSVPQEILISSMRTNQKYFSLLDNNNKMAPYFITVANLIPSDNGEKIIHGNERVLRARLEDAKFFWDQDRKNKLESYIEKQDKIIFHASLGSVKEKTSRIVKLATIIANYADHNGSRDVNIIERAAYLCKADLTTGVVGEFPELQGLMGYYYAIESGEHREVAKAIRDHYKPIGQDDSCPEILEGQIVAMADKIDTLAGLFAIGEKPTGSGDPYALRRAALGVIRIIIEKNLFYIPLLEIFEEAIKSYNKFSGENAIAQELLEFFIERLKVMLKGNTHDLRYDIAEAVFSNSKDDNLARLVFNARALQSFLKTGNGSNLLEAYKRATNIVLAEEKKDKTKYEGAVSEELLQQPEEKKLYEMLSKIKTDKIYSRVMQDLTELQLAVDDFFDKAAESRPAVDAFFDKVTVNCEDKRVRKNRLLLLSQFRAKLHLFADFSKIKSS